VINHPVFRSIFVQILVVLAVTVLCAALASLQAAFSVLLGGAIIGCLNSWAVWRLMAMHKQGLPAVAPTLRRYYQTEAIKLLSLMVLLGLPLKTEQPLAGLGLELDKAFLILGLVLTALLVAVPNAKILSKHFATTATSDTQVKRRKVKS